MSPRPPLPRVQPNSAIELRTTGSTYARIGAELGYSPSGVRNFLRNRDTYGIKKGTGRLKKLVVII